MSENTSNVLVRPNVVAFNRFVCTEEYRENDPDELIHKLSAEELYQYLAIFWTNRKPEILAKLTLEQKSNLARLDVPDPYDAVCTSHRYLLPPPIPDAEVASQTNNTQKLPPVEQNFETTFTATKPVSEQEPVIVAPVNARQLVMAPPGTGKTHTVVQRLAYLAGPKEYRGDLTPVLVVSFSRAAAAELTQRLNVELAKRNTAILQLPQVSTLDSFVGALLTRLQAGTGGDYDASIARLRGILERDDGAQFYQEATNLIRSRINLVIVDEVQDLVGPRARLLSAILRLLRENTPGLLLLGDLRQSIHEFQLRKEQVPQADKEYTSFAFVRDIRDYYPDLQMIEFTKQWRFKPACQEMMQTFRMAMDDSDVLPGENPNREMLAAVLRDVPLLQDPRDLAADLENGSVAVLAWGNKEVQQLEVACSEAFPGRVKVMARGEGSGYPDWMARLFGDPVFAVAFTPETFCQIWLERVNGNRFEAMARLDWLVNATGVNRERFTRDEVVAAIRVRPDVPSDLRDRPKKGDLWISTIHQAKGREFDAVVVANVERMTKTAEECRHAYVAVTRAKSVVYRCRGRDWLPDVFQQPADAFVLPSTVDEDWRRVQTELWKIPRNTRSLRITSRSSGFVLESPSTEVVATFAPAWNWEFGEWARSKLAIATPQLNDYTARLIDLRTFTGPQNSLTLVPILSGCITRR